VPHAGKVIDYGYHRPGKSTVIYPQQLLLDRPDVSVLRLDHITDVSEDGEVILPGGGFSLWFVFPGSWFDVGRFHRADGTLIGWYTNLCTPVVKRATTWSSTDLFLDLWQPREGAARWLDEDEFAEAVACRAIDDELIRHALAEQTRIASLLAGNSWPPAVCRSFLLTSA
jgi:predicted RNA-binding protein associated with RNAse of E/G family